MGRRKSKGALRHNNWAEAPHCTSTEAKGRMAYHVIKRTSVGHSEEHQLRTQITRQPARLEMDDQRLRQILHRGCSISADSAVLSSHQRGFGNVVGNAGRMANVKVSVCLHFR